MPGTPSRPLLLEATRASKRSACAEIGSTEKELMASTMRCRPAASTIRATSSSGFRMPVLVSQWMIPTWLMAGSSASAHATPAGSTTQVSPKSSRATRRPMIRASSAMRSP